MNEITIYNTRKSRLETVDFEFTSKNTTCFEDAEEYVIYRIADAFGGLLIQETGHSYPILVDGSSRSDIGSNQERALNLLREQT